MDSVDKRGQISNASTQREPLDEDDFIQHLYVGLPITNLLEAHWSCSELLEIQFWEPPGKDERINTVRGASNFKSAYSYEAVIEE